VVFVHNHHSSEDPAPSQEDVEITRRLEECEMLATRVLDHVILGTYRYYSFSDKGLL